MKTSTIIRDSIIGFAAILLVSAVSLSASEWPHWLGPNGNNYVPNATFSSDLGNYTEAWKINTGKGYASVSVADGRAYTMGHDGEGNETVYCLDASTGEKLWSQSYPAQLLPRMHTGGPNATITVLEDQILTMSKDGLIQCLKSANGEKVWSTNLIETMGVELPRWGFASSPIIHGNHLLVSAGKVAALDLKTGKASWISKNLYHAGYTTPVVFRNGGKEYIASLGGKGITILKASDGTEIDHHPFKAQFDMVATTPIVIPDSSRIFISGNTSSELLDFDGNKLSVVWSTKEIRNSMNNSVIVDDVIYGIDGKHKTSSSRLVAVNLSDGEVRWESERFGYGNTIGLDDTILVLTEAGELVTAALKPSGYHEISRRKVLDSTCWTTPTFANGRIYVRNDIGDTVCLAVK